MKVILTKTDGTTQEYIKICYGFLQKHSRHPNQFCTNLKNIEYVVVGKDLHTPRENSHWTSPELYYKEASALLRELPMLSGCFEIMPRRGVIRAKTYGQPADKVILGLMIFRNLREETGSTYMQFRKLGMPRRLALLCSSMFSPAFNFESVSNEYYVVINHENSLINFHTFGKKAALEFLHQTEYYNPWFQDPINNNGYYRDLGFANTGEVLNSDAIEPELDDYDETINEDELDETGKSYYRRLTDCFSFPFSQGDEYPIENLQEENEFHELMTGSDFLSKISADVLLELAFTILEEEEA
jgi:hypothetical protein